MNKNLDLCKAVCAIAKEASALIMRHYAHPITHEQKADCSPVTIADQESNDLIVAMLQALTPDIAVVSEEGEQVADAAGKFWLVDPLDGTKSYIAKDDEFSVNIALIENHRPVIGVLAVPAKNLLYWAVVGDVAYRQIGEDAPQVIRCRTAPKEGLTVMTSKSHGSARLQAFLRDSGFGIQDSGESSSVSGTEQGDARSEGVAGGVSPFQNKQKTVRLVRAGSAYKIARVAEGSADLYPRLGPTMEWDTAAGQCIVEAAGGSLTTLEGAPFLYGKIGWLNGGFMVRGRLLRLAF